MVDNHILSRPPILQAILQVKYQLIESFDIRNFLEIRNDIKEKYPIYKENVTGEIKIQDLIEGKKSATIRDSRVIGYLFANNEKSSDCTLEIDKFTFTKHGNYTNWIDFINEASFIWDHISKLMTNVPITRISSRFINKIEIDNNIENPEEYINTSIHSNDNSLPDEVDSYILSYKYKWGENKNAIVTQSLGPYANNILPIIFDIDVINSNTFTFKTEEFLKCLEEIQLKKDEIFFKNLTKKTLKLLK